MIESNLSDTLQAMRRAPFHLDEKAIGWVESTLARLSVEDKAEQLFCNAVFNLDTQALAESLSVCKPGGVMFRPSTTEQAVEVTNFLNQQLDIPPLIAANLERGADGIVAEGTRLGSPMAVAATDDVEMARRLGDVCGSEGAAVGANWAFAPIIDIDVNFRNPITNLRTFGSDPERVGQMGAAYVSAVQSHGVAASIKHFPGDGVDERDQHLLTSVNDLPVQGWDATYGQVYRASIEAGAMTVMVAHIQQPEYSRKLRPGIQDKDILPASLAPELMGDLLRGQLGFNGLVVTDATLMAGFTIPMARSEAVPSAIAAGADMFLFTRNLDEDVAFMKAGIDNGTISSGRLDCAVARILGLKAALGLHQGPAELSVDTARERVGTPEHQEWARECAAGSITLVKEQQGVLPLTPERYRRLLFVPIEAEASAIMGARAGACEEFRQLLVGEGFDVDTFAPRNFFEGEVERTSDYVGVYDAIVYVANLATKSNQTVVRIEWKPPMGADLPHHIASIPTIFISIENPYHLLDVPRAKTFINTYGSAPVVLEETLQRLTGRAPFTGKSPVDPFCGRWDTRL